LDFSKTDPQRCRSLSYGLYGLHRGALPVLHHGVKTASNPVVSASRNLFCFGDLKSGHANLTDMNDRATTLAQDSIALPLDAHAKARLAVRAEEVRLLYVQAGSSMAGALIVALVVSIPLYSVISQASLIWWLGFLLAVTVTRYLFIRRYWITPHTSADAGQWERYFVAGALASGVVWGALGILVVMKAEFSYQAFVGMALAGMAAGATSSLSSRRLAFKVFLLPILLPFGVALLSKGGAFQTSMGVLVLLFAGLLLMLSQRISDTLSEALTLRFENDALLVEYDKAKQDAEIANRSKSAFLANMSHEIRTPLTAIIGFTEMIMDGKQSPDAIADAGKTILRNSRLLLEIINDILDMSKIEADKIAIERIPYSPLQVVMDVQAAIGLLACDKGLDFKLNYVFPIPETVMGDPTRLKQILLNLSSNAIKFTEKGQVQIELKCEGEQLKIAVIDTGIGIREDKIDKLFIPFIQADNTTTRRFGGSGLGLYISRRLAQMLGGDVTVTSTLGTGSRFEVCIATGSLNNVPFITALDQFKQVPSANEAFKIPTLQGHILLAEDSKDNQRLVTALSESTGARITVVEDGQQAVTTALSGDYSMVLMDMQMPVMGGLDAIRILRQAGFMRPIVAFTANVMKEEVDQYQIAGCNGYLTKPIDRAKFYQTLAEHLPQASAGARKHGAEGFFESAAYKGLVAQFVAGLPKRMEEIDQAMTKNELDAVRIIAHTLKGSGASFGYPQLTEPAAQLEQAARQGEAAAVRDKLVRLKEVVEVIVQI
jgi:signal transduction histidine kinase/CheY-like chemotaxis protein/HPt (histidine-containing phosphotransfer) domain-containing protein